MSYLTDLVIQKASSFPTPAEAAQFFEVSPRLIEQWIAGSKPVSLAAVERVFDPEALRLPAPLREATWEGKQLCVMLPFYKDTNPLTMMSVLKMWDRQKMGALMLHGDADIENTRNHLATQFLLTGSPYGVMLDDDMVLPCGSSDWFAQSTGSKIPAEFSGMHAFSRLMSAGKTLIGATYVGRKIPTRVAFGHPEHESILRRLARRPLDEILPVDWVATGCLFFSRQVLLDIQKKFPELAPVRPGAPWRFFDKEGGASEDVSFCVRARAAGHQPFADLGLVCAHLGRFAFLPDTTADR